MFINFRLESYYNNFVWFYRRLPDFDWFTQSPGGFTRCAGVPTKYRYPVAILRVNFTKN